MADIQKVINAWKIFRDSNPYQICDGKEFRAIKEPEYCMGQMIADTIELLWERKPKTAHIYKNANGFDCCSECDKVLPFSFSPYCSYCGAKIEREEAKNMKEIEICFSEEDFNKILKYMEDTEAETVQGAVMDAIKWGKYHHYYCE